jgi:hypothetical protein
MTHKDFTLVYNSEFEAINEEQENIVGLNVLTVGVMKSSVVWDIMPYNLLKVNRHIPPKRGLIFNGLHGVISQVIEFVRRKIVSSAKFNILVSYSL